MKQVLLSLGFVLLGLTAHAQSISTLSGSLDLTDPAIPGDRLFRDATPGQCATTKTYPGTSSGTAGVHYDTYTISNSSASASTCVTITLAANCTNATGAALFLTVYTGSFSPTNLATNYKSDLGTSPSVGTSQGMSVTLAPSQSVVLVVNGLTATAVCNAYSLQFSTPVVLPVSVSKNIKPVLAAYPSPVVDVLHIEAAKAGSYTLFNANGATVRQFTGSDVSLRDLPGGVYMLQQNDTKATTRVVKL
ncbi:T9SS type A sorting domain-containing protein [Hymenobacter sp. 15J16-1T3B]|uniref:T9SS type A sorting domain-containing protein n=1 Tax=Hymenobacter sp. 15J16-1T3B TaxID=2886941 RepID=UPI001D108E98|nr:T9SS type A sorting domain-containing protein [Hymenobacter sp. 15J16-1T3B]MCC3156769.1 T9SS type A sorting domain-containing protein [Hymenobacter sp. 15J16-1T3B]